MRKQSLLFGLIFVFLGFAAQGQIYEVYHQGFETSETVNYTVTGTNAMETSICNGGGRSIKLQHNGTSPVVIEFDTIDCSNNSTLQYISLEFAHICNVDPNNNESATSVAIIQVKRPDQSTWTRLSQAQYNMTNGGSSDFNAGAGSFSNRSYSEWQGTTVANAWWKQERFDLNSFFRGVAANQKKLQIKMTLGQRKPSSNVTSFWYLDDLSVKASPSAMINPVISMVAFPDLMDYPSSRGAKVVADITTQVTQGMNTDSIYLLYTIGSDNTQHRLPMTSVPGVPNRYMARIPFCGYDTIMRFHIYAKDNSTNQNMAGYPSASDAWVTYRCVRGRSNQSILSNTLSNSSENNDFPFPAMGDARSEFVFDQGTLEAYGYRAGAITSFDFTIASSCTSSQLREDFTILMGNVETTHTTSTTYEFSSLDLLPVYKGNFTIPPAGPNTVQTVNLQDTFFYAGKDILMQIVYNNTEYSSPVNPLPTYIKMFPTVTGKKSLFVGMSAMIGYNPYSDPEFQYGQESSVRPHFVFNAKENVPLLFDCGVSLIQTPSPTNPAQANTNQQVKVYLKNYGALPISSVPIFYQLDQNTPVSYTWNGTLAAGDSTLVTLSSTQQYSTGYHTITAWVGDTVVASSSRNRDHEPYNDTAWTEFIACDGPMSGVCQIGGATNADFAEMEEFLFALNSCGVDGALIVKLAPGEYDPFVMPVVNGLSASNYIQFQPLTDSGSVVFRNTENSISSIVNLTQVHDIRFENIVFEAQENGLNEMVLLASTSNNIRFVSCAFEVVDDVMVAKVINTGGASNLLIADCSILGGTIGVDLSGIAVDNLATNNIVRNNYFHNQVVEAIRVVNQASALVRGNYMNDVLTNASYVVYLRNCYGGTRIEQNKVYTTHGACGIGMSDMHGTSSQYIVIANNMIVSEDDGTSNLLTTALNVISSEYAKIVYNTIKLNSPEKVGIAAATFGGSSISNSWFVNNFVTCLDSTNYAFNYIPGTATNNQVHHNAYYSQSALLNRYQGSNFATLAAWQAAVSGDSTSRVVIPGFICATPVDLRSYNTDIKGWALPMTEVTVDHFDTMRSATAPCVGAFEFDALHYDFSIEGILSPIDEYCFAPDSIEVVLLVRNRGVNTYIPGTPSNITMIVSSGTQNHIFNVSDTIAANGITEYHTGKKLLLRPNGRRDSIHHVRVVISASFDPNVTNDTTNFTVRSNYHGAVIPSFTHNSTYATMATIPIPSTSLDQWNAHVYDSGDKMPSTVYWYADSLSETPIYRGNTFDAGVLYSDTSYYVEQRRELDMIRITEVQISRTAPGATSPMPSWMSTSTTFAVEITNVGDYPASLLGDTVQIISDNNSFNNKNFVLPDVTIQPGATFVLQFRSSTTNANPASTAFWTATLSPNYNTNFGVLYRDGSGIQDAVLFKNMHSQTRWTSLGVPSYVWQGAGIVMPTTNNVTAGVKRTGWPSASAAVGNTANYWTVSNANNPMRIGTPEENLRLYYSNGCPGVRSRVDVHLVNVPHIDIALDSIEVNEGCGLGNESISVMVHNYGIATSGVVVLNLKNGNTLVCADTVSIGMTPQQAIYHTFSQTVNMRANSDTTYNFCAYVTTVSGEFNALNDTTCFDALSLYTPLMPTVSSPRTINYGTRDTITAIASSAEDSLIWFDRNMMPLDSSSTLVTPILYGADTFYVTAYGHNYPNFHVGTLATQSTPTGYPSPYNPNKKFAREQYLYTASDLRRAGHTAGTITAISFYLDTIPSALGQVSFTKYRIKIGTTEDTLFANGAAWKTVNDTVFDEPITVSNTSKGWIRHEFSTPFVWDGTSSVVIEFAREVPAAITSGSRTRYTQTEQNTCLYKVAATNTVGTGNGSVSKNRPDALFEFVDYGCASGSKQVIVNVIGVPSVDAAVSWPTGTGGSAFTSCSTSNIDVVLENRGGTPMNNYTIDYIIDGVTNSYTSGSTMPAHSSQTVTIATTHFSPGRHHISVIVNAVSDSIHSNDTIESVFNVRFCAGTYTIGDTGDYATFTAAVDSLHHAGIDGPVVFEVASGIYDEQIRLGAVDGVSVTNTVTFQSETGNASDVELRYATTQASNYVLDISSQASNYTFKQMTIYAAPTATGGAGNYANAVMIANAKCIIFDSSVVKVKETINNLNASCVVVGADVDSLIFTHTIIEGGYYGVKALMPEDAHSSNFIFTDNEIRNFWYQGVTLRRVDTVSFLRNTVRSGVNVAGRALTGLWIAESQGSFDIEKNQIYLIDERNGGKRGIRISKSPATNLVRSRIYNNMISVSGTGISGQTSSGIWIDSSSNYINVYYNSVRVYAGNSANTTHAMHVGVGCAHTYVLNNIFSNFSKGYAYYVMVDTNVSVSNYNVYYSDTTIANRKLAFWGGEASSLEALRAVNNKDENSLYQQVYFQAEDDLHLTIGQFSEMSQYNPEVPEDIDGTIRLQPRSTIGAHEYIRVTHDMAIVEIIKPEFAVGENIETDPILVKVRYFNNGNATETGARWQAKIKGVPNAISSWKNIPTIAPSTFGIDSMYITPDLGVIDTQIMMAYVSLTGDTVDNNDTIEKKFFLSPAFNLQGVSITTDDGCELRAAPISITVKNVGLKPIPANTPFSITYTAELKSGATTLPNLPISVTETVSLSEPLGLQAPATFVFNQPANLYPTNTYNKIQVNLRGSVRYPHDLKQENDQTSIKVVNSFYTPSTPVGEDLHIPYATWDTIWASQAQSRVIRWFRDSTAEFFYNGSNNYNRSRHWDNTPQYFHDSTYYLNCLSHDGGDCPSHFSAVNVILNPQVPVDVAIQSVVQPWDKVYMIEDSVVVRIVNYGTSAVSNIPVVAQLWNANRTQLMQEIYDTCTVSIAPGATYDLKFDSLLHINTPTTRTTYFIRTWTDLATDQVHLNDTLRHFYEFHSLAEDSYCTPDIGSEDGIDITHVSFSTLNHNMPASGFTYTNFGTFANPEVPVLHLQRGMQDTFRIATINNTNDLDYSTMVRVSVYMDYNRDGVFDNTERAVSSVNGTNGTMMLVYTVPNTVSFGYMRLRVIADGDSTHASDPCVETTTGQAQDFLVYVDEHLPDYDLAVNRIITPSDIITQDTNMVQVVVSNKGRLPIDAFTLSYVYAVSTNGIDTNFVTGSKSWTGNLMPGQSECVFLNPRYFPNGSTVFRLTTDMENDADSTNNVLEKEFYRFHEIVVIMEDEFDGSNVWYAPRGDNKYTHNYWQRGVPNKQNLATSYSEPNVWGTDLLLPVASGKYGTLSYLYTPVINIASIRPDTLSFMMATNMSEGSSLTLEYKNYEGSWKKVEHPDVTTGWYNGEGVFEGTTSGFNYQEFRFPLTRISGEFAQRIQFRFVYRTERAGANASYGDGCVIDNFRIGRAIRPIDVGVIAITEPTEPRFGETVFPKVVIKNYGSDTIRSVSVEYRPWGSRLSRLGTYTGVLAPGATDEYTFTNSFVVTNDFPDTFDICAYTSVNTDIYRDNDSVCENFYLSPLENDMASIEFVAPLDNVVAGDSVAVTMRIRNYGSQRIHRARLTYVFNSSITVTEEVNFDDYFGVDGLQEFEYFNYTFRQKFRAAIGLMTLKGYCDYEEDTYHLNDTISTQVSGITVLSDLKAKEIVKDTSALTSTTIGLVISNIGARAANDFEVGYWIDNDTTTKQIATFHRENGLPALSDGLFLFEALPQRPAPYNNICAYVHNLEDNDRSNDTTCLIVSQYVDIKVNKVLIEENQNSECQVRLEVENIGNMTLVYPQQIRAAINGESISFVSSVELEPGIVHQLEFDRTISKNSQRQYSGTGKLTNTRDINNANNETNIVEVVNYFEGITVAEAANGMKLSQNFPNPFEKSTRIDFYIPFSGEVKFFVMDELGRLVYQKSNLFDEGEHSLDFGTALGASGVYYYGIEFEGERLMRKMVFKR